MIHDICGFTVDFSKIVYVGPIMGGDERWKSYKVTFDDGSHLNIYENTRYNDDIPRFPRSKFIEIWKQSKVPYDIMCEGADLGTQKC